jgi:hypothetical protein
MEMIEKEYVPIATTMAASCSLRLMSVMPATLSRFWQYD